MSSKEDPIAFINRMARRLGLNGYSPTGRTKHSLCYWNPPRDWEGTVYIFGYSPWKSKDSETGKTGFFALKYRQLKNGNCKLVKKVRYARRKIAKKKALEWYDKYYKQIEEKEVDDNAD